MGVRKEDFYFVSQLIRSCREISEARRLHRTVAEDEGIKSRFLGNLLVEMYGRCGSVREARSVFDEIDKPNLFSCHMMIQAYAQNGQIQEAEQFFHTRMTSKNEVSWNTLIAAHALNGHLQEARRMLDKMPSWGIVSCTSAIKAYAQALDSDAAKEIFDQMQQRDLVSWTVMVDANARSGHLKEAMSVFEKVPQRDSICWMTICQAYAVHGHIEQAKKLFDAMPERTLASWTIMIHAYAQNGHPTEVLDLFREMDLDGTAPDEVTFVGVLTACSHGGFLKQACEYFTSLPGDRSLVRCREHYHCMIDALGRTGQLNEAEKITQQMQNVDQLPVAWTALLDACRIHGDVERGSEAAQKLIKMQTEGSAPYLLLSNIYAAARRPEDVILIRQAMKAKSLRNDRAGQSEVQQAEFKVVEKVPSALDLRAS